MKIVPNEQPRPNAPSTEQSASPDKRFSNVLDRKKPARSEGRRDSEKDEAGKAAGKDRTKEHSAEEHDAAEFPSLAADVSAGAAAAAMAAKLPGFEPSPVRTASAGALAEPATITALADEITASLQTGSTSAVDIQFSSKTLQGLHVRVVKVGEDISVRFTTNSDSVAALLTRNTDSLTAALQARGFQVGAVTVGSEPKPASSERESKDHSGSQGGRQQGGRERRGR